MRRRQWLPWLVGLLVSLMLPPSSSRGQLPEDPLVTLRSGDTLSEEQDDHAEATSLYTHGRILLQRRDLTGALRQFQRAWRFDPSLVSLMEEVVPLAVSLKRDGVAARYAILAAEHQEVPVGLLTRMAALLAQREQFTRALHLYQRYLERRGEQPRNFEYVATQFEVGRLSFLTGKFPQASKAFAIVRAALQKDDAYQLSDAERRRLVNKPDLTYTLLGESFLRAEKLDAAEAMFRAANDAKPNRGRLGLHLALVEQARGHRDQALVELNHYFSEKLSSAGMRPYQLLEQLLVDTKDRDDVSGDQGKGPAADAPRKPSAQLLDRLRQLSKADPDNPMLGYFLAGQLRRAGLWKETVAECQRLLKQSSAADGYQGLIDAYYRQRQIDPLLEQLAVAVSKTGSLAPLGDVVDPIVENGPLLDQLADRTRAWLAKPDGHPAPGAAMALALLQTRAHRAVAADQFFLAALEHPGPAKGQFAVNLGFKMLELEQPKRAARAFQHAIDEKLLPDEMAQLYFYLSGALVLADRPDEAISAAREAAKLAPDSPRLASRVAWVHYQAKQLDVARQAYLDLLEHWDGDYESAENRDVMRGIRLILSNIELELQHVEAAEEWLQQVLDEFPEDVGALNDLGYLWCDRGVHLQRALAMVQKAVTQEPENKAYRDSLGWALYRLQRYPEAIKQLERAAADEPVDGVILDHLGDAYSKNGQVKKAKRGGGGDSVSAAALV